MKNDEVVWHSVNDIKPGVAGIPIRLNGITLWASEIRVDATIEPFASIAGIACSFEFGEAAKKIFEDGLKRANLAMQKFIKAQGKRKRTRPARPSTPPRRPRP
jgi:hypothetical protein